tara:strand:+ start:95 stop:613 length:519 start_codon:yes stop_codon:yes gene_type:complete
MLDSKFFRKISADVVMKYRKHTFDPAGSGKGAKDVFGKPFKEYSSKSANVGWRTIGSGNKKRSVFIDSYANKKKTGNIKRQYAKFANSKAPVLTGDLLRDYGFQKFLPNGFSFGFKTEGSKVKRLAELGRVLSSKQVPIPKSVEKFINKQADKYVENKLGKIKGGNIDINIT